MTSNTQQEFKLKPIAWIDTPFSEKFGIPRQSQALSSAKGVIRFANSINVANACRGLDQFSHLWLSFVFHEHLDKKYSDTVRPPRLGGNDRIGVFASRATYRPNPLGLSLVKNEGLVNNTLHVSGVDLLTSTPILDIKPYLSYADYVSDAKSAYAQEAPKALKEIDFSPQSLDALSRIDEIHDSFTHLLSQVLAYDPRPAYKQTKDQDLNTYFIKLYDYEIEWRVHQDKVLVDKISKT